MQEVPSAMQPSCKGMGGCQAGRLQPLGHSCHLLTPLPAPPLRHPRRAASDAGKAVQLAQELAQWAQNEAPRKAEAGAATAGKATGLTLALQAGAVAPATSAYLGAGWACQSSRHGSGLPWLVGTLGRGLGL